jgi:hypothetical protein
MILYIDRIAIIWIEWNVVSIIGKKYTVYVYDLFSKASPCLPMTRSKGLLYACGQVQVDMVA